MLSFFFFEISIFAATTPDFIAHNVFWSTNTDFNFIFQEGASHTSAA